MEKNLAPVTAGEELRPGGPRLSAETEGLLAAAEAGLRQEKRVGHQEKRDLGFVFV
jgi:hypothetical protein